MKVLVACEFSGTVMEAFRAKGHDAWSCDLLPSEVGHHHFQMDVREVLHRGWDLMIAHPPCTYLTVTGNKWFKPEYRDRFTFRNQQREDALDFVRELMNANIEKKAIENPVSVISSRIRKPNQIIHPYQFGHADRKRTCL